MEDLPHGEKENFCSISKPVTKNFQVYSKLFEIFINVMRLFYIVGWLVFSRAEQWNSWWHLKALNLICEIVFEEHSI
jgi:hypothetical protein